jgi:flagellar biosynthesis regulator FlaF
MSNVEMSRLLAKLDALAEKIESRCEEFRHKGGFEDIHAAFLDQMRKRDEELRAKVEAAAQSSSVWAFTNAELRREYENLVDEMRLFLERREAER